MRLANTLAGCATVVWLTLFFIGRSLLLNIPRQGVAGHPSASQIDHLVVLPASMLIALLVTTAIINAVRRCPPALSSLAGLSIVIAGGYFLTLGGGV